MVTTIMFELRGNRAVSHISFDKNAVFDVLYNARLMCIFPLSINTSILLIMILEIVLFFCIVKST